MKLLYKVLLFTLPAATSFTACNQDNHMTSNPGQPHYATVYMDWEKFNYERGSENPAMIDLENQIDRTLYENKDINRIVIKSINKEGTVDLSAREWGMGYRKSLQNLENKYVTQSHPIHLKINDTLDVYNAHLSLQAIDEIGIRVDDAKALAGKGVVFREVPRTK